MDFFLKLSLNVVENVAKVKILVYFLILAECNFPLNYSTNMCCTSYEPTVMLKLGTTLNTCTKSHDHEI